MKPNFRISGGQSVAVSLAALIVCSGFVTTAATAGGGDVAAGLLGGLAVGAVMGSAVAHFSIALLPRSCMATWMIRDGLFASLAPLDLLC